MSAVDTKAPELVLASQSASRRAMLAAAGVPHYSVSPAIDEEALKDGLRAEGRNARQLADALAEAKALKISIRMPGALVLGCDQTLELDDGEMLDKAVDKDAAAAILKRLSGATHKLHSAAVICENGAPVWRLIESATLSVRALSDAFIASYLDADWENCRWCVGCYRIEGPGAQLFTAIKGTHFAIQGLPLLGLLDFLRVRGVVAA
ncbi:MAG: Maf family protein [Sphingomonadaceae bacterium]|jgi:septum formation protein